MIAKTGFSLGVACAALMMAGAATAQDLSFNPENFGLETGVSTLGAYAAPTYEIDDSFSLRMPVYFGNYEGDDRYEGNPISYEIDLQSTAFLVDYHPFQGSLRLTAGMGFSGYNASTAVTNPELGGINFTGDYAFELEQEKDLTPILAVGYVQPLGSQVALTGEMGGKFGTYKVGTKLDAIPDPVVRGDMAEQIAEMNKDLKDIKVTPYLSMGLKFSF